MSGGYGTPERRIGLPAVCNVLRAAIGLVELASVGERRTCMRVVIAAAVALFAVGCGGGDGALSRSDSTVPAPEQTLERPRLRDAVYDPIVPFETLTDWVSYGDAVVVVTVTAEVAADPSDELGAMGWPNGQSIAVEQRLWQHPSAPVPPNTVDLDRGLLVVEPGDRSSLTLRLASVGRQYLLPLGRYDDGGWTPVAPMLEVVDGRVDPNVAGTYRFADRLSGLATTDVATVLSTVAPDRVADAARPADPAARFAATVDPNTTAATSPSVTVNPSADVPATGDAPGSTDSSNRSSPSHPADLKPPPR
jgi:hypothetical protein